IADRDREQRRRAGLASASWPRHMRPVWDGAPMSDAGVLVRCYHGLGDTIQFSRYLPILADHAAVRVEAQPELIPLLAQIPGIDRLYPLVAGRENSCSEVGCATEIDITELPYAF